MDNFTRQATVIAQTKCECCLFATQCHWPAAALRYICVYQQASKKFLKEISGMVCWGNVYRTKITRFYFRWTIDPVDLSLAVTKQLCSKWILEMIKYISTSPQMIVKGSVWAGISKPLDEGSSSPGSGIVVGKTWAKAPVKMIILMMQIQTVILVRRKQKCHYRE